ncbi:ribosomal protein S18 acetylase RimI-like enzyme [Novosphingobium kunmingense]|uniref:Ribosomal protein S18 acetylase RimI-like enzyme n=1 Tax=Novosphingobium kunmingense TaxID=1211806 RepID=A0A2N0HJS5_9SPHN|nr:GNAT family N-acetyltransferase [Novosphingobium kunmingense]PKB19196.1 ribosomal protein S18 acetylase RimI-like enzyme [Novosphingobium kunmingense]
MTEPAPRRSPPLIGEAGAAQGAAMAVSLARAFADDPAMRWIMPDAAERHRRLPPLFRTLVADELASGWALASPKCEAVTLWRGSEKVHESPWRMIAGLPTFLRILGRNVLRGMAVGNAIEAHHPKGLQYHYLHFAGVDPAFQGRGWGGAAIRAGQDRARAAGLPVYLETATPENVGLYQALGFRVTGEWTVPRGGPHFWSMLWEQPA